MKAPTNAGIRVRGASPLVRSLPKSRRAFGVIDLPKGGEQGKAQELKEGMSFFEFSGGSKGKTMGFGSFNRRQTRRHGSSCMSRDQDSGKLRIGRDSPSHKPVRLLNFLFVF